MPDSFGRRSCGQPLRDLLRSHCGEADRNDLARVGEALRVEHPGRHAESLVRLPLAHEILEGRSGLEPPDEHADDHVISLPSGEGMTPRASYAPGLCREHRMFPAGEGASVDRWTRSHASARSCWRPGWAFLISRPALPPGAAGCAAARLGESWRSFDRL